MRIHERHNRTNLSTLGHDAFGNYEDFNGIRRYSISTPITEATSRGVAPHGSLVQTTNPIGRESLWMVGASNLERLGGVTADLEGVAATGAYTFLKAPVANDARTFNGVAFSWKATPTTAVQAQLVTEASSPNNTILGENLANMVAKLNASVDGAVSVATYSTNQTSTKKKDGTKIIVTYDTEGIAGNAYTLDSADDTLSTRSGATLSGGVATIAGYSNVALNITQATTDAPTVAGLIANEGGGDLPVIARTSAGIYTFTKTGAFPANKTFLPPAAVIVNGLSPFSIVTAALERTSNDVLTLRVLETVYTAANNITIGVKEISAMIVPVVPIHIIIGN
jgi:hypothetical protein